MWMTIYMACGGWKVFMVQVRSKILKVAKKVVHSEYSTSEQPALSKKRKKSIIIYYNCSFNKFVFNYKHQFFYVYAIFNPF